MSKKPIVSVLNLKSGLGCSVISWSVSHTLGLDIYQHDKAIHHYFLEKRKETVKQGKLLSNDIQVHPIDKRRFESGIYDLGSDINYPYVRQIISKSDVIIIPTELGYEVLLKTIATLKYVEENYKREGKIIVLFNRLDSSDTQRETNYTKEAKTLILNHIQKNTKIEFLYMRHSFAMLKNLAQGFYYLDNYIHQKKKFKPITQFDLLRNLRWHSIDKLTKSEKGKKAKKAEDAKKDTDFFDNYKEFYLNYTHHVNISKIYNLRYNNKNRKLIKDMLILTTKIKGEYSLLWEDKDA